MDQFSKKKRAKDVKKNILLLVGVIILFFLFFECFLRIFAPQLIFVHTVAESAPPIFIQGDYIPWQIKPSIEVRMFNVFDEFNVSVKHNSLGYRDYEFNINKPTNTSRILFLGGSFTHGFGVELDEIYLKIFERKINEGDKKYEVINAGYKSGEGPNTQYLYLKKEGLLLNPNIVVIGFLMENDFEDHKDDNHYFNENGELERISSKDTYVDEDNRLRTKEQIKRGFVRDNLYKLNVFLSFKSHTYVFFKNLLRNSLLNFYKGKPSSGIYANEYSPEIEEDVEIVFDFISRMKKITEENNISLVLVIIPKKEEVYEYKIKDEKNNILNWSRPYDLLTDFAEEKDIPLINLLPPLKEYASNNDTPLYFSVDPHWNKNGHQIAGQFIYKEFRKKVIGDLLIIANKEI